uniref:Methyltransferase type 11 domain-containing protein n=1 Tax=Thermosporothrix sp. COM3 TaxID=2490863 RepID=A0A455SJK6_9CHLR|nr:hypothetical protein KTC_10760 [Thermosporothrix sp. COM3]
MSPSSNIWTGKANSYDRARPTPPPALLDLLTQLIATPQPALVVDLGSGTGLSSAVWADRAQRVIGIEPNADMRKVAMHKLKLQNIPATAHIEYREGVAHQTGLPDACANIVTAAQAFHWMEPTSTLAEVARILRPGGLFAVYDYDWPPLIHWELDRLGQEMGEHMVKLVQQRGLVQDLSIWPKSKHLDNMRECGHFRFTRETWLHHTEQGDATRFLEMMQTSAFSGLSNFSEQEIGIDRLRQAAQQYIGPEPIPWYMSYHVLLAVK